MTVAMTTLSPAHARGPVVESPRRQRGSRTRRTDRWLVPGVLAIALGASVWIALSQTAPPDAVPATAAATEFSAERAVRHLDAIAAAPRFVGSAGHAATRAYLLEEITRLGLTPELQATTSALRFPGAASYDVGSVENVLVRIPGTNSTGAILLSAHYDGGATGPAAGDCGACVVTLLETLRALQAGPPLANDVILMFSDAEEVGDLGAHAFATQHPWMADVRLALNFESQGAGGPATLYVASTPNTSLVGAFARAAPGAVGSSFFAGLLAAFPQMRAACDLQDYMDAGSAGMGFIVAGNSTAYHTRLDDAAGLDRRTVQHFGGYALGLVRHFADRDLGALKTGSDAIFFNAWPGRVIHYPARWAVPTTAGVIALLALALAFGRRARRIEWRRTVRATATFMTSVLAGVLVPTLVWWGVRTLDPDLQVFMVGTFATAWYLTALVGVAVASVVIVWSKLGGRLTPRDQVAGGVVGFAFLAAVTAVSYPAGSYVFLWPLAGALPVTAWMLAGERVRPHGTPWLRLTLVIVSIVSAVTILLPAGLNGFLGLTSRLEGTAGLPVMALSAAFAALLTGLLFPMGRWVMGGAESRARGRARRGVLRVAVVAVVVVLFAIGTVRHGFDEQHPRPDQVRYELDVDRGEARWVTSDARLDEWTSQFIPATTPRENGVHRSYPNGPVTFAAPASALPIAPPELEVLEDVSLKDLRLLRLRLVSRRAAPMLEVRIEATRPLTRVSVGGQVLDFEGYEPASRGLVTFSYAAPPRDGVEIIVRTSGPATVRVGVADLSSGIPDVPGWRTPTRPRTTMPAPGGTADGIIVRRTFHLVGSRAAEW